MIQGEFSWSAYITQNGRGNFEKYCDTFYGKFMVNSLHSFDKN